jgi:hypothetical protein
MLSSMTTRHASTAPRAWGVFLAMTALSHHWGSMTDKDIICIDIWKYNCYMSVSALYGMTLADLRVHLAWHKETGEPLW